MKEEKKKMKQGHIRFRREVSSNIESLPDELVMDILSRVPTLELGNLRCVCKRWRNIVNVKTPLFRTLHSSHSLSRPAENNLLLLNGFDDLRFIDLASRRKLTIKTPYFPSLPLYVIIGSCNGLLCLGSKWYRRIVVMNPFTHEHMVLDMEFLGHVSTWSFGFDFVKKIYKVVVVVRDNLLAPSDLRIYDLDSLRSSGWRRIECGLNLSGESPACFVNGRIHWTHHNNGMVNILSFDLADEVFILVPTPDCLRNTRKFDLFVLRGCLCIIRSQPSITPKLEIWVMKDYGVKESWVKEVNTKPLIFQCLPFYFYQSRWRRWHLTFKGLGSVQDGEVLLKYKRRDEEFILFSSNPTCEELQFISHEFEDISVIHTASLNWI